MARKQARTPEVLKPMPQTADETKRQKFERLGEARMNRALNSIRLIGNLSTYNYDWTAADVDRIRMAVIETLEDTLAKFERRDKAKSKVDFHFSGAKETQH